MGAVFLALSEKSMGSIDKLFSETPTAENPFEPPTAEPSPPDIEWTSTGTGGLAKTGTGLTLVLFGTLSVLVSAAVFGSGSPSQGWPSRQGG